jgi:VCBS repeat-containing protein
MRPKVITTAVLTNDLDGIAQLQTLGGAGSFTLNGALVSSGVATAAMAQKVSFTSTGNISARSFTVTGTDPNGHTITESRAGPNNNTVVTTNYFKTVSSVTSDGAVGTNTQIGWMATDGCVTQSVPVNWRQSPFNMVVSADLTAGTGTFGVQYTVDDPQGSYSNSFSTSANWRDATYLDKDTNTADADDTIVVPVRAVRGIVTVGSTTGVYKFTFIQGQNA